MLLLLLCDVEIVNCGENVEGEGECYHGLVWLAVVSVRVTEDEKARKGGEKRRDGMVCGKEACVGQRKMGCAEKREEEDDGQKKGDMGVRKRGECESELASWALEWRNVL